ncbi:hypothetical protein V8C44DRAFT_336394 [Trichoderma aethiopicum]
MAPRGFCRCQFHQAQLILSVWLPCVSHSARSTFPGPFPCASPYSPRAFVGRPKRSSRLGLDTWRWQVGEA